MATTNTSLTDAEKENKSKTALDELCKKGIEVFFQSWNWEN
jgi:hypothetical protein